MGPVRRRILAATQLQPADGPHRPTHQVAAVLGCAIGTELNDEPLDFLPRFGGGGKFFIPRIEFFRLLFFFLRLLGRCWW